MDQKSNTQHLHEEGVLNKDDLHEDQIKAIDSLSPEEEKQIIIQILKSFQELGYTQVQDSEMSEILPIQAYIQRVS